MGVGLSSPANNSVSDYSPSAIPEPSGVLLFATCIAGLALQRKWWLRAR
jgi:hypothetical protein